MGAAYDFACGDIQCGKERGRSMTVVIMRAPLRLTWFHWQQRLAALQGLYLALLSTQRTMARVSSRGFRYRIAS